jgi:hypothetical protein
MARHDLFALDFREAVLVTGTGFDALAGSAWVAVSRERSSLHIAHKPGERAAHGVRFRSTRRRRAKEVQQELIGLVMQDAQLDRPRSGSLADILADALERDTLTRHRAVEVRGRRLKRYR